MPHAPEADADLAPDALPEAQVVRRDQVSLVWLLPLLALGIGGWLGYKALSERGPTIEIELQNAAGLEEGRTKVKFKDVIIGQISDIRLANDLRKVLVTAQLEHGTEHYLTDRTRFWVARPRVTASGVSGLETLLSGPFVAIDPVLDGRPTRRFEAEPKPPVITNDDRGSRFRLKARSLGSLSIGAPVYYRSIQVGQLVDYNLPPDANEVQIDIFVEKPHDQRIHEQTRFWNASGIDVSVGADGIQIATDSLVAALIGGVAFGNFGHEGPAPAADHVFPLFPDREKAKAKPERKSDKRPFLMVFKGSVRGLNRGAPVLLRGIEIGKVTGIELVFDPEVPDFEIPVRMEVDINLVGLGSDPQRVLDEHSGVLEHLVDRGLRGQLKQGSLLTGQLYVEMDIHPDAEPESLGDRNGVPVVPTIEAPLEAITSKVDKVLTQVGSIPFEQIGTNLDGTLAGTRAIVDSAELRGAISALNSTLSRLQGVAGDLDARIVPELSAALRQADATLASADAMIAPEAPLSVELDRTLRGISAAARSVRLLADYLERHPEALLQGKGGGR